MFQLEKGKFYCRVSNLVFHSKTMICDVISKIICIMIFHDILRLVSWLTGQDPFYTMGFITI